VAAAAAAALFLADETTSARGDSDDDIDDDDDLDDSEEDEDGAVNRRCSKTAHLQTAVYRGNPVVLKRIAIKGVDLKSRDILKELNAVSNNGLRELIVRTIKH
jgi:hypothetical protein